MFTGIVEEIGRVTAMEHRTDSVVLRIRGPLVTTDAVRGASVAVNGVCLTVTGHEDEEFTVDVMQESLDRSSLGTVEVGGPVNLERAMSAQGRFGGHIVQGHVDGTATCLGREPGQDWEVLTFSLPVELARYVVLKGSITVDGVSLTVSGLTEETFAVSLIPTTLRDTTLGELQVGSVVNIEVDVLGKYVERILGRAPSAVDRVGGPAADEGSRP
ncbi:riboflavin synthase alpha chain [Austwickia chelonae]|uniref:Riboflavin synthase n=1 Tax=Austwickia chelonae NBRC 105200 TaxID=1184607 RepID=K6W765_9MICO|nr:riboflavin synthase [Austwickia chelonae]GAB77667.1 riboflavin synthase alpha chain [Austwickia chelonae NBRC 105200]SEW15311.1 riboflavin synthase alpha chain [Austwickia chelonae]